MTLLAKKHHPRTSTPPPDLSQHTRDVMDAAEAMFGTASQRTRLGECWQRFFKIADVPWPTFHANLLVACGLHDWGKANRGFQDAMSSDGRQAIRHEHLSALLIADPSCWKWLEDMPGLDREVVLSAVLTHHLKARYEEAKLHGFATPVNASRGFESLQGDPAFIGLVAEVAARLGLDPRLDLSIVPTRWTFDTVGHLFRERKRVNGILQSLKKDLRDNAPRRRFLHAVRSALIAADAAGSSLRRTNQTIREWISGVFDEAQVWDSAAVRDRVIEPRTREVARIKKKPFEWNKFQDHCADPSKVPERSLLLAPCGSGKTLAAWRWIEERAKRRVGHVLFLYPTRATATEGFRDYVSWAPEAEAALMHGTSEFDLDGMFDNPPDGDYRKGRTFALSEADQRMFALGFWGRRAFSATVDQFLAFLQYGYGPICLLPVLADSVVVIDEVHSFDRNMFSALKKLLTDFDGPVLCMTATLPKNRYAELTDPVEAGGCGLKAYEERPGDLETIAAAPRYRVRRIASAAEAETAVREALKANKRVLWVVNQVRRAHRIVCRFVPKLPADLRDADLRTPEGVPVHCYHSRFRLTDRVDRHHAVMRALKDEPGPALGVTTQVCEMSLDIDVDLLVTEECPVTALVQRMGRCNRNQKPRALGEAGDVLVYAAEEDAPYLGGQLTGVPEFLALIAGRDLSQDDLDTAMWHESVDPPPSAGDVLCSFLESGPYAVAGEEEFRDSEEFNRPCVLPGDVDDYLRAKRDEQPGFVLPVPRRDAKSRLDDDPRHAKLPKHLQVATAGRYHAAVGFCDQPLTEWGTG
jgi:CRISPR-associated endonuclease/helicase Cas3